MLGAIIGDIVGSRFEFHNIKTKDFDFFHNDCFFTDDTVMTCAVASAIMKCSEETGCLDLLSKYTVKEMQTIGRHYPYCGYGGRFERWIFGEAVPYNSFGNGAAMRVSPVSYVSRNLLKIKDVSRMVTEISHNHQEGIKGAETVAVAITMLRNECSIEEVKKYAESQYGEFTETVDEIRKYYSFNETCQETVPQAFQCFFEGNDFEDVIRNAISIGGDSDTLAAIAGSLAEARFGIPDKMKYVAISRIPIELQHIVFDFYDTFMPGTLKASAEVLMTVSQNRTLRND